MAISDEVRFLEEKVAAFAEMYRKEIEQDLNSYGAGTHISLRGLRRYDWDPSLENHFYPMSMPETGREIGLILPFRRFVFHTVHSSLAPIHMSFADALRNFSDRRHYHMEYYEFAWQHESVIEGLRDGILPKNPHPKSL